MEKMKLETLEKNKEANRLRQLFTTLRMKMDSMLEKNLTVMQFLGRGRQSFSTLRVRMDSRIQKNEKVLQLLELNQEIFSMLLTTFLLLLLAETIWEGSVSAYMNINYLLIIVIVSGVISVLTGEEEEKGEKADLTNKDYLFIGTLGIAGSLIIWYKIRDIGMLAYFISIIAGALIILLSLLLFEEDENGG